MKVRIIKTPKVPKGTYHGGQLDPVEISAYRIPPLLGEDDEQGFPAYPAEPELSDAEIKRLQKALEKKETAEDRILRREMQDAMLTGAYMGMPVENMAMPFMPQYAYGGMTDDSGAYLGSTSRRDVSKGKMRASFDVPSNLGYGVGTEAARTPVPVPVPLAKKVKFETLNTSDGRQVYSPVFQGSWTDTEIRDYWKNIPMTASNGREILRGQAWQDVQGNRMARGTTPRSSQALFTGTSPAGGSYVDAYRDRTSRGVTMAGGGYPGYQGGGEPVPIEAEGGEMIQTPDGELSEIHGPSHENGGAEMVVPEGSKIYSKRIKIDGKSMADRKEARDRKMNRLGKILESDPTNMLYRNTARRTAESIAKQEAMDMQIMEIANPIMQQEMEAKEQKAYGGKAKKKKYIGGGGAWMRRGMKDMESDVYGGGMGGGEEIMQQSLYSNLGSAATGIAALIAQAAQGKPQQIENPLFAETAHLRPYMHGGPVENPNMGFGFNMDMNLYQGGGGVRAQIVTDPNDPAYRRYLDSQHLYETDQKILKEFDKLKTGKDYIKWMKTIQTPEAFAARRRLEAYNKAPLKRLEKRRWFTEPISRFGVYYSNPPKQPYTYQSPVPPEVTVAPVKSVPPKKTAKPVRSATRIPRRLPLAEGIYTPGYPAPAVRSVPALQYEDSFILQGDPDEFLYDAESDAAGYAFAGGGKAKHWIQGAVNPKHRGFCTPMTKSTCTPRRKALARTFKKHHGFHAGGGEVPCYECGGRVQTYQGGSPYVQPDPYTYYNLPQPDGFGGFRIKAADEMLGPYSPEWLNNQNRLGTGFETWPGGPSMDQLTYDVNNPQGRYPVAEQNLGNFRTRTSNMGSSAISSMSTNPDAPADLGNVTFSFPKTTPPATPAPPSAGITADFNYPGMDYTGTPGVNYGDLNTSNFWQGFDPKRVSKPGGFNYVDRPSGYEQEYEANTSYYPNYSRLLMGASGDEQYPWAGTGKLTGSLPATPEGKDANLYGTTAGNIVGGIGTALGTIGPLLATLKNRRGDRPNINAYREFGREALEANALAQDQVARAAEANRLSTRISNNTAKARNRNSAQSINTLRALDAVTDLNTDMANISASSGEAQQMINLLTSRAGLLNQRDQARMSGEQARDLADRRDRDAYFQNLSRNLSDLGTGLQTFGKNINQDQYNRESLGLMNELSKYGLGYKKVGGKYQLVKIGPAQKGYEPVDTTPGTE